jgi:DNA-directed RNA polymerase subunit M/transcription elongation factor TFIIS
MEKERRFIRKQLERVFSKDQISSAEKVLYDQSITCAELKGGDPIITYRKLCYERLGELFEVAPENRMNYLLEEVADPTLVYNFPMYLSYRQKEEERREFLVSHSMGMTVQRREINCTNPGCNCTSAAIWLEQTRSGDEAMTCFIQCMGCGKRRRE